MTSLFFLNKLKIILFSKKFTNDAAKAFERPKVQRPILYRNISHTIAHKLQKPAQYLLIDIMFGKKAEQATGEVSFSDGTVGATL